MAHHIFLFLGYSKLSVVVSYELPTIFIHNSMFIISICLFLMSGV